jgi:RNA polymerase sigma-54 factor
MLEIRHEQKQILTHKFGLRLVQAIGLLGLSDEELEAKLREEAERNPLLERPGDGADGESQEPPLERERLDAEAQRQLAWEAYLDDVPSTPSNRGNVALDDLPSLESTLVEQEDLASHLGAQLVLLRLNDAQRRIAALIVGNLDEDGYLRMPDVEGDPLFRLAREADVDLGLADRILRQIQRLEPRGCGARDLQECLLIQVAALKHPRAALLATLIQRHLDALETWNLAPVARALRRPLAEVEAAALLVRRLDPRPGRNYSTDEVRYITPDVFVHRTESGYTVVLNDDGLSRLRISPAYRQALRNGGAQSRAAREFLRQKQSSAEWFLRSIHQRQRTLRRVTESIVKFQRDFLDRGVGHLRPLILQQVADDIGVHESTVSRVTTAKYVHTPQGIYELKYFFTPSIGCLAGGSTSSEAVKSRIQRLVAQEDALHPLSDGRITDLLRAQGIDIARRTVAKYREELGVLTSRRRKRHS